MKGVYACLAAFALVLAHGCKSKPTLVGSWSGNIQVMGAAVDLNFEFFKDGKLSVKQTAMGQTSTQKGDYKAEEKSFSFKPTSVDSPSLSKEASEKLNGQIKSHNKTVVFTLEWKDGDTINVTQQGAPAPLNTAITLKRMTS